MSATQQHWLRALGRLGTGATLGIHLTEVLDESSNAFFCILLCGIWNILRAQACDLLCVPPAVENATSNIDANDSKTFFEDVEYHCDHGHITDGDSNSNTTFSALCGAEGEFLPASSSGL